MTAAEVEEVMGPDLGPLFYALYNEVAWVHATFHEYRQLYGTSKQRVDLLNETAPFFFLVLEGVLWRDILMHINRLTDPPEQGKPKKGKQAKYENLTLLRLPLAVSDPTLVRTLEDLIRQLKDQSKLVRDLRDKTIAHTEFHLAMKTGKAQPLSNPSRKQIDEVLLSVRNILNAISKHYRQTEIGFEFIDEPGGAEALLDQIKFAQVSLQQRMERHRTRRAIPEDHEPFPSV